MNEEIEVIKVLSDFDLVVYLHKIVEEHATGNHVDYNIYEFVRKRCLQNPKIKIFLPKIIKTSRTIGSFWITIKEIEGYANRRKFLKEEFEPLLSRLEQEELDISQDTIASSDPIIVENKKEQLNAEIGNLAIKNNSIINVMSNKVFIVHGHDKVMLLEVEKLLRKLGLEPVILNQKSNRGQTIIEKLELNSDVGYSVVLLSPCDLGKDKDSIQLQPRARQNVILELGYFMAKLGRQNVFVLKKLNVEEPSDFTGVIYTPFDEQGGWQNGLVKELIDAGYPIDANNLYK